ncbi:hypothetical protein [Mariniflexile sp. HMF6888]|uniref:hypothetical protein n=1 Tax=Mariniflexile sp. HMF6888 TaxID=3373086 RepID=UPI00378D7A09
MRRFTTLILFTIFLSCAKKTNIGDRFVGKWENPEKPYGIMTIEFKNEIPDKDYPFFIIKTQDRESHEGQLARGILNLWYWDGQYNLALDKNGDIKMIKDPNPSDPTQNLSLYKIIKIGKTAKRIE